MNNINITYLICLLLFTSCKSSSTLESSSKIQVETLHSSIMITERVDQVGFSKNGNVYYEIYRDRLVINALHESQTDLVIKLDHPIIYTKLLEQQPETLIYITEQGKVTSTSLSSGQVNWTYQFPETIGRSADISDNGRWLAFGSQFVDRENLNSSTFREFFPLFSNVHVSSTGILLASSPKKNTLLIKKPGSDQNISHTTTSRVENSIISKTGKWVISSHENHDIIKWDTNNQDKLGILKLKAKSLELGKHS